MKMIIIIIPPKRIERGIPSIFGLVDPCEYGVLCVEMEAAALYTIAAKYRAKALAIFTISDSLITHEATSAEERQSSFNDMVKIALETI